jgi:hypothetical protein
MARRAATREDGLMSAPDERRLADPAEIADFLLARYAEDQALLDSWDAAHPHPHTADPRIETLSWRAVAGASGFEIPRNRFAAEIDAKTSIVETCQSTWDDLSESDEPSPRTDAEFVLRLLAAPYAAHPHYRAEWRP